MTVLGAGMAEQYGTRRQQRAQLVCENCGHVMNFDLTKVYRSFTGARADDARMGE